ncbi:MAG: hypothetical protein GC159_12965 [Phycisphaera sp.]|nr:hypothetical protein [Phycisphaera sp.]
MFGFEITKLFFDKKAVTSRTDRATRKVLSRFGAFVRRTARSSIRKRKKSSPPGSPPSSHVGLLKKFIFFGYEPQKRSVVIGPVQLTQKGRGEAPRLLEHGGTAPAKRGKKRATYRPRPYMGPAFEKERPKLPAMWRDSIK